VVLVRIDQHYPADGGGGGGAGAPPLGGGGEGGGGVGGGGGGGGATGAQPLWRVRKAAPLHIGDEMTQKSRIGHG